MKIRMIPLLFSILFSLVIVPNTEASSKPSKTINVYLYGEKIKFTVEPFQHKGTTMVQFEPVFKALGYAFQWEQKTKSMEGENGGREIKLSIGNRKYLVNGVIRELTVSPVTHNGTLFIPLSFIEEVTGKEVVWDRQSSIVKIQTSFSEEFLHHALYNRVDESLGLIRGDLSAVQYLTSDKYLKNVKIAESYLELKKSLTYAYGEPLFDSAKWTNDSTKIVDPSGKQHW